MKGTKIHVNIEVPMRAADTGRTALVLDAEYSPPLWSCLTRHWQIGLSDIVLRDPVCRAYPMFHEAITVYRNKKKQGANTFKNKAKPKTGSVLRMVAPAERTDGKQGCRA